MPIGTEVRLASGGSIMTVVDTDLPDRWHVMVAWTDAHGNQHERSFPVVCLDIVRR